MFKTRCYSLVNIFAFNAKEVFQIIFCISNNAEHCTRLLSEGNGVCYVTGKHALLVSMFHDKILTKLAFNLHKLKDDVLSLILLLFM